MSPSREGSCIYLVCISFLICIVFFFQQKGNGGRYLPLKPRWGKFFYTPLWGSLEMALEILTSGSLFILSLTLFR